MYLQPAYGSLLAVSFLGERLEPYHFLGIMLIMGGIVLATLPTSWAARVTGGQPRRPSDGKVSRSQKDAVWIPPVRNRTPATTRNAPMTFSTLPR